MSLFKKMSSCCSSSCCSYPVMFCGVVGKTLNLSYISTSTTRAAQAPPSPPTHTNIFYLVMPLLNLKISLKEKKAGHWHANALSLARLHSTSTPLIWALWVQNRTTFPSHNSYFEKILTQ